MLSKEGASLFGRADFVKLEASAMLQWLDDLGSGGAFRFYLLFGGVPYRRVQQRGCVEETLRLLVAGECSPLRHEVEFVMAEFLGV